MRPALKELESIEVEIMRIGTEWCQNPERRVTCVQNKEILPL